MLAHSKIDGSDGGGRGCDVLDSDIKFCEYGGRALLFIDEGKGRQKVAVEKETLARRSIGLNRAADQINTTVDG